MRSVVSRELSNKFANMSFVCACLVVCQHLSYDHAMCGGWVFQMLFHGLPKAAVPFFFLASGFFLAGKMISQGEDGEHVKIAGGGYLCEVKKRIKSLLVPYLLWSVIWMAFISSMIWYCGSHNWPSVWSWFGLDFTAISAFGPMWFLRNLMLLVLVSPILFYSVCKGRAWFVGVLFGFELARILLGISNEFLTWTFRLSAMAYFCLGAYLCHHPIRIPFPRVVGIVSLLASIVLVVVSRSSLSAFFFVPLFMLGLFQLMPDKPLPSLLVATAFPIYLVHPFVIKLWGSVLGRCRQEPFLLATQYLVALGICIGVANLLQARFRRLGNIFFGGRG